MSIQTNAGASIAVCATLPATHDAAGFNALAFATVGEVTNLPEFGRAYALITHKPLATRATLKRKGSYDEGQLPLELALDENDAGQQIMAAAAESDDVHAFRVTMQNGDKYFMLGMVMDWKIGGGDVDAVTSASSTVELTSSQSGQGIVKDQAA
jgi:hypothetical protein